MVVQDASLPGKPISVAGTVFCMMSLYIDPLSKT
jgi:hypothetical protein